MAQTDNRFATISRLSKEIQIFAAQFDIARIENILPHYTREIEQYFASVIEEKITQSDVARLEQIKTMHEVIVRDVNAAKIKVSDEIKRISAGKQMRNTYPQQSF